MNAFETELGVMTEIAKAVDDMGWLLPTDVQGEAIPLILGGGDVLMAAETCSGKTGAFCLPVLQVVYETLKEQQSGKKGHKISAPKKTGFDRFHMNVFDRTEEMAIDADGTLCQSRDAQGWHGCRSTRGVVNKGKYYYEAKVTDEGLCRVGWSTDRAALDLGTDKFGFGFGGTGKKSFGKQFDDYGEAYGMSDVIGCLLDLDHMKIKWAKNGKDLGLAFDIPKNLHQSAFYAAVVLKNAEMKFNFGEEPFKYHPGGGYVGLSETSKDCQVESAHCGVSVASSQPLPNAPYCIVIEPSRELAEQTLQQFNNFNRYLDDPRPRALLVVGGTAANQQIQALQNGVDIVVGTPGRMEDLISTGHLSLQQIRFFILDEADGLLGGGYEDMIMRMHRDIPKVTPDGKRLQMIVCSATLHNFQVKKLAERVMHFPTWVDLKGEDTVPETVHHVVCWVNPREDIRWKSLSRRIATDGVHAGKFNPNSADKETLSEAIKILKGEYCVEAIRKHKMDKALIFCRTKLDCDNMEAYFTSLGGGPEASHNHQFSCVCLHADRSPPERKANLDKFKQNKVRFLICTDVAARGLDITGLPFVINVTLPDEKQNYIHRIGRVGRAERMGLAISLAAALPEKVWYHTCPSKGKSCYNTNLREQRGCCIWYNEEQLLAEIEDHLNITIPVVGPAFDIPVNEFDGKVVYGEKKKDTGTGYKGHVDFLAPTVRELAELEKKAQLSFLNFQQMKTFRK